MFNVDMSNLKKPLENRGMTFERNNDATVTINNKRFSRSIDVEFYLMDIPRKDIPVAA